MAIQTNVSGRQNAQFSYDPKGRLFKQIINGVTTYFVYDGDALVAEYNASKAMTDRYIHGDMVDNPLVQYSGTSVSASNAIFLHKNHKGVLQTFRPRFSIISEALY